MKKLTFFSVVFMLLAACGTAPVTDQAGELEDVPAGAFKHVPGTPTYNRAMRAYQNGRHWQALNDFKSAAIWADKKAQFNVGAMYFNGEGTEIDKPRAWAWFQLAAERRYPEMVDMAQAADAVLDAGERERARTILMDELLPVYGDAFAIDRTARRMRQDQMRLRTGSRVGERTENVVVYEGGIDPRTSTPQSVRHTEGTDVWDFYQLVAIESELYGGLLPTDVQMRDFEIIKAESR